MSKGSQPHLDMLYAKSLYYAWWKHSASKGTPKDGIKLLVKTSNTQAFKVEGFGLEQLCGGEALLPSDLNVCIA